MNTKRRIETRRTVGVILMPVLLIVSAGPGGVQPAEDAQPSADERSLHSPGLQASMADDEGTLLEDWGSVGLVLHVPDGTTTTDRRYEREPVPTAVTKAVAVVNKTE